MAEDLNSIGHHPDPPVWASTPNLTTSDGAPTIPGLAVNDINIDITNGVVYSWDGDTWNVLITDGGGGGTQEVFHVVGSGDPVNTPVGDAVAFNDAGNFFTWSGAVWQKQF